MVLHQYFPPQQMEKERGRCHGVLQKQRVTTQKAKGTQMRRPQMPYLLVHKEKAIPINKRINTVTKIDTSFGMQKIRN